MASSDKKDSIKPAASAALHIGHVRITRGGMPSELRPGEFFIARLGAGAFIGEHSILDSTDWQRIKYDTVYTNYGDVGTIAWGLWSDYDIAVFDDQVTTKKAREYIAKIRSVAGRVDSAGYFTRGVVEFGDATPLDAPLSPTVCGKIRQYVEKCQQYGFGVKDIISDLIAAVKEERARKRDPGLGGALDRTAEVQIGSVLLDRRGVKTPDDEFIVAHYCDAPSPIMCEDTIVTSHGGVGAVIWSANPRAGADLGKKVDGAFVCGSSAIDYPFDGPCPMTADMCDRVKKLVRDWPVPAGVGLRGALRAMISVYAQYTT